MNSLALQLRAFYFFANGVGGVTYFLPVWLENRGLNFEDIGLVMSMTSISKIIFGTIGASLSDRGCNAKKIIGILAFIGIFGALMLFPHSNLFIYMLAVLIATGGYTSSTPIGETITITTIKQGLIKQDYAQIRVVGTFSYAFIAIFSGYVLQRYADDYFLLYEMIFCCIALIVISFFMHEVRDLKAIKESRAKFRTLFKQKDFNLVIAIQILYYMSYGMQNALGPAYWEASGIKTEVIGLLVIPMIISEAVLFLYAKKFFSHVPYQTFFIISTSTFIIRWIILAFSTDPIIISCALFMHGLNFGCTHLGMMVYIRDVIPDNLSTRAQAMYSIGAGGICYGISMICYGYIYNYLGGKTFLISAFLSFIAMILAMKLKGIKFKIIHRNKEKKQGVVI